VSDPEEKRELEESDGKPAGKKAKIDKKRKEAHSQAVQKAASDLLDAVAKAEKEKKELADKAGEDAGACRCRVTPLFCSGH